MIAERCFSLVPSALASLSLLARGSLARPWLRGEVRPARRLSALCWQSPLGSHPLSRREIQERPKPLRPLAPQKCRFSSSLTRPIPLISINSVSVSTQHWTDRNRAHTYIQLTGAFLGNIRWTRSYQGSRSFSGTDPNAQRGSAASFGLLRSKEPVSPVRPCPDSGRVAPGNVQQLEMIPSSSQTFQRSSSFRSCPDGLQPQTRSRIAGAREDLGKLGPAELS